MRSEFIQTDNMKLFDEIGSELESREGLVGPSLAMATAPAGRGKTEAAKRYAVQHDAVYIAPMLVRTPCMMLQDIAFELSKMRPGRISACLETIREHMSRRRRLIIVDEADLIEMRVLEMLRNLNEATAAPVMLIGENGLRAKVAQRKRLESRIRRSMEFQPISPADVHLFFKRCLSADLEPEAVQVLHRHSGGDWRPVLTTALAVERAMSASNLKTIPADLIRKITGKN